MTNIPEMNYNAYGIFFYGEPDINESPEFVPQHTNQQPTNVSNRGNNPLVSLTAERMKDDIITRLTMQVQELLAELEGIRIQSKAQKDNQVALCKICYQKDVSACALPCGHVFCDSCSVRQEVMPFRCPFCRCPIREIQFIYFP